MIFAVLAAAVSLSAPDLDKVLDQELAVSAYNRRVESHPKYVALGYAQGKRHDCEIARAATDAAFALKEIKLKGKVYVMEPELGGPGSYELTEADQKALDLRVLKLERDAAYRCPR